MLLEDVYSDSLIHTLTGLQLQQRQHIGIVLGIIVMRVKYFVPRLARLASSRLA
uniref:Uncharacterized protein n=1 Tax=uncultured bacterium 282 TaxID=698388 RepID=E3T655_9BACT|nr:hypothetical protein [uncultured bacterium 282]